MVTAKDKHIIRLIGNKELIYVLIRVVRTVRTVTIEGFKRICLLNHLRRLVLWLKWKALCFLGCKTSLNRLVRYQWAGQLQLYHQGVCHGIGCAIMASIQLVLNRMKLI